MMENYRYSAFHGANWRPRAADFRSEMESGLYWPSRAVRSEHGELREAIVFVPPRDMRQPDDPDSVQHVAAVDYVRMHAQMLALKSAYANAGVVVREMRIPADADAARIPLHNLMFARDMFFMTGHGAIVGRMGSEVRAGEERLITFALAEMGIPICMTVTGSGTFEGADALWLRKDLVAVGVGNRTNMAGFEQVRYQLDLQGVEAIAVRLPVSVQHLLGVLVIVDSDLAAVRTALMPEELRDLLRSLGYGLIAFDESDEVRSRFAMNFVCLGRRKVVMAAGNPDSRRILRDHGVEVIAEVSADELFNAAGGIGCATGIINRASP